MLAVNLMICLFILCIFGVLDAPLREFGLKRPVGALICLLTAGLLLLEDIPITSALLASPGGFFIPLAGAVAVCAWARSGTRRYLAAMSVCIGIGAWLFNQVTFRALEALPECIDMLQGAFCLLFASLMDGSVKSVWMMSVLGYHTCDIVGVLVAVIERQTAYEVLGKGTKALAIIALTVGAVAVVHLQRRMRTAWRSMRAKRGEHGAQPETG